MDSRLIPAACLTVFLTLVIVHVIMHSHRPIRAAVLSLLPGIIALICVDVFSGMTGVFIPVSPLTLAVSSVLGIPGVTCLLIITRIL